MNNQTNRLIPEIRFPEFVHDSEWDEMVLDTLGKTISGLSGKSGDDFGEGKPYVTYKQVFDKAYVDFSQCAKVKISDNENQNELQKGDVLFTTSSETPNEVGFASVVINSPKESTYLNSFCFSFRPYNLENLLPEFARYLFHSPIYRKSISVLAQGSTRYNISKGSFLNLKLPLPKTTEQQKIADFLLALDELLTAYNDKLETLKTYKQGLMQNLFPQEGEIVPKLRFREFEKDGEWIEKTLDYLTTKISDGIHTTPNYDVEGEYYFINGNNLIDGKIWVDKKTKKVSEEEYKRHKRDLNDSTILLSINGTIGNIAKYNNEKVVLGKSACYINVDKTKIDKTFVIYFIQTDLIKSYFESELTGSTIKNLSLKSIKETLIKVPNKSEEQQRIVETLSSLDELIAAQTNKIAHLKAHKKGLMQGLFPKITI